jgi:hypothetical protein
LPDFSLERQLMQHVGQRLNMHQPMLNRNVQQGIERKSITLVGFPGFGSRHHFIQGNPDPTHVLTYAFKRRPVRWLIRWQAASHRVDAECKQAVELRVETSQTKYFFLQKIPIKSLQMSDVEDDSVTLGNRPIVNSLRPDDFKQGIALVPGIGYSAEQRFSDGGFSLDSQH